MKYCLFRDDDGHWYVIPSDKREAAEEYVSAVSEYWDNPSDDMEEPAQPDWMIEVSGSYTAVTFESPEIFGKPVS